MNTFKETITKPRNREIRQQFYCKQFYSFVLSVCLSVTLWNNFNKKTYMMRFLPNGSPSTLHVVFGDVKMLDRLGVNWNGARDTANDCARWRQLVARCSDQNGRN